MTVHIHISICIRLNTTSSQLMVQFNLPNNTMAIEEMSDSGYCNGISQSLTNGPVKSTYFHNRDVTSRTINFTVLFNQYIHIHIYIYHRFRVLSFWYSSFVFCVLIRILRYITCFDFSHYDIARICSVL